MYETASKILLDSELDGAAVVRSDKEINAGEHLVRKMIFEHLTLNLDHDLSTSLALLMMLSVVEIILKVWQRWAVGVERMSYLTSIKVITRTFGERSSLYLT